MYVSRIILGKVTEKFTVQLEFILVYYYLFSIAFISQQNVGAYK